MYTVCTYVHVYMYMYNIMYKCVLLTMVINELNTCTNNNYIYMYMYLSACQVSGCLSDLPRKTSCLSACTYRKFVRYLLTKLVVLTLVISNK